MDDGTHLKIVSYHEYCKTCKHNKKPEHEEPCNTCLTSPVNEASRKPICYKRSILKIGKSAGKNKESES